jgi:hypothetical protein
LPAALVVGVGAATVEELVDELVVEPADEESAEELAEGVDDEEVDVPADDVEVGAADDDDVVDPVAVDAADESASAAYSCALCACAMPAVMPALATTAAPTTPKVSARTRRRRPAPVGAGICELFIGGLASPGRSGRSAHLDHRGPTCGPAVCIPGGI